MFPRQASRYIRDVVKQQHLLFSGKSFDGFNQVILASSYLRKGLEGIFYHNAVIYAKECLLAHGIERYDLFRDYNNPYKYHFMEVHSHKESFQTNIRSKNFQLFMSRCEDILTEEVQLVEYKSLYPPKVSFITSSTVGVQLSVCLFPLRASGQYLQKQQTVPPNLYRHQ